MTTVFDRDAIIRGGFRAIRTGNTKALERLLATEGTRIRADPRFGASLGTFAVRIIGSRFPRSNDWEQELVQRRRCLDVLLAFGIPLKYVPGAIDVSPLQAAVQMPDLTIARELIAFGADPLEGSEALRMSLVDMVDPRVRDEVEAIVRAAEADAVSSP